MKWFCFSCLFFHSIQLLNAQNSAIYNAIEYDTIYTISHNYKLAKFRSSEGSLNSYIENHLTYPEDYEIGSVHLKFVVNLKGDVTNIEILKGVKPSMNKTAIDLLLNMPKWIPGANSFFGGPVVSYQTLSIHFYDKKKEEDSRKLEIFTVVEQNAEFPGGMEAMFNYIQSNLEYPSNTIEGKVILRFVIDFEGFVRDIKVVKSISPEMDEVAVKVVESMPQWKPAKQRGKPVNIYYTLPITIKEH